MHFRETIWKHRVEFLQKQLLSKWDSFTIWNAGKQGRKLYRSLTAENQSKVMFCYYGSLKGDRGGVAQWVARLTHDRWIPVSREFEPHQRPLLFP